MASLSDSAGAGGGRAGAELMVPQFLLKTLHAILAVRSPTRRARTRRRPRRRRRRSGGGTGGSTCRSTRCITLLRPLYPALRFLPAYRAFRTLCASGQVYNYETGHRVGSFATPFSRAEEAAMRTKRLAPVETQLVRLVVSVQYLPSLDAFNFEVTSLASAAIITDYVGSPAAERMRAFPASLTEVAGPPFPQPSRRPQQLGVASALAAHVGATGEILASAGPLRFAHALAADVWLSALAV